MKFMKKAITLAAIAAAAIGAQAATDGVADAAQSVATFTNTIGSIPARQIRVFGVLDATMLSTAAAVENAFSNGIVGVQDGFCVADSTGGAVQIQFGSAGINSGNGDILLATSATSGTTWEYHQSISINNGAWQAVGRTGTVAYTVPAGVTQTDLNTCAAANVRKSIINRNGRAAPADRVFTDIMTITATPV